MTRIALIGDLHGNKPATLALEEDLKKRNVDRIWCLGDIVGKGPDSAFTCDWARAHCEIILSGNWDEGVALRQFPRDSYYWDQLGEERMRYLTTLPREMECWFSGAHIRMFHGRHVMEKLLQLYADEEEWGPYFKPDFDTILYADAHKHGLRLLRYGRRLVNSGSVGNGTGFNQVQYCIMEGEEGAKEKSPLLFTFIAVPYDYEQAARDAENTELPGREAYMNEVRTGVYSRR